MQGVKLDQLPSWSNAAIKAAESKAGEFQYPTNYLATDLKVIDLPPTELSNNAVYFGQWSEDGMREGRGVQIWRDGSKYEGYWSNDKAQGPGRLIHQDGSMYEGFWQNDHAHGLGKYSHLDGACYEGEWKYDK